MNCKMLKIRFTQEIYSTQTGQINNKTAEKELLPLQPDTYTDVDDLLEEFVYKPS